jgi:putative DNA primase/helicase
MNAELYDPAGTLKVWNSYLPDGGIGFGTLVYLAKEAGWEDTLSARTSGISKTLNDAGNADRLVKAAWGRLRYCKDKMQWLVWIDSRWHWDSKGYISQFTTEVMRGIFDEAKQTEEPRDAAAVARHASASLSLPRIQAAMQLAQSYKEISVSISELDHDPYLVGVQNGVIDARTGIWRENKPEYLITRYLNATYDAEATCPTWEATIDQVFMGNKALKDFYQRAAGYSTTGDTSEQVFFFLHGTGSNGKSTVINVQREIGGSYALQTSPEVLMAASSVNASGPTPEVARLAGPRLVVANETEEGQRFAESRVKQLTGGDAITARVLHGSPFDFVPWFKLWIAGNHKPVIRGDDHGIWRRIMLIPFLRQFTESEKNKHLPELLRKEYSGILNWLIAGGLEWQRQGLNPPLEVVTEGNAYRTDMDLMQHWLDDQCVQGKSCQVRASDAYASYRFWAQANGHHQISSVKFAQKLKSKDFEKITDRIGTHYVGLKLK